MEKTQRIAFAMFRSTLKSSFLGKVLPDAADLLTKPQSSLTEMEAHLLEQWEMHKRQYVRLADAALGELDQIIAERQGR